MMRQLWKLAFLAGVTPAALGCYTTVPLDTSVSSPPVGERLSFELTDRGRAEIADRLGPGVRSVEGLLTQMDGESYVLRVWKVAQIDGVSSRWSGEQFSLNRNYVGRVSARRLERGRTWLTAGAASAGLVLFAKSQGLFGSYQGGTDDHPPPPPASSRGW